MRQARSHANWAERGDSNPRPPGPQTGKAVSSDASLRLLPCGGLDWPAPTCTGDGPTARDGHYTVWCWALSAPLRRPPGTPPHSGCRCRQGCLTDKSIAESLPSGEEGSVVTEPFEPWRLGVSGQTSRRPRGSQRADGSDALSRDRAARLRSQLPRSTLGAGAWLLRSTW